jgi:DNA modification methylase
LPVDISERKQQQEKYRSIKQALKKGEYEPKIHYSSSEHMKQVGDNSIQLIVTSPPYNVGKDYGTYNDSRTDYLDYLDGVWTECKRVLCRGGRIAINVANTDRKPYSFLCGDITSRLIQKHDFKMRGDIIWNKGASAGVSTAWGSWRSASNPTLRDVHEHILVFSKENYGLDSENHTTTISPKEFCHLTQSVWKMSTVGASNGHPAPFPLKLPTSLIKLYTYVDDTVLDPFLGSGTTCVAAKGLARKSIGYEIDQTYQEIVEKRVAEVTRLSFKVGDIKFNGKSLEERHGPII